MTAASIIFTVFWIIPTYVTSFSTSSNYQSSSSLEMVMEPLAVLGDSAMIDAAIAVASGAAGAAAGAASQMPRIQKLERDLDIARSALSDTEAEMANKLSDLEDQLFKIDQEFESQSARMKKQFDTDLREEVEKTRAKVKKDYQFTLDIKLKKERSNMLQEKLEFINSINGEKDTELVDLRLKQKRADDTKEKLEKALIDSKNELERINALSSKNKWWPF